MYPVMYPKSVDTIITEIIGIRGYIMDTLLHALGRESKRLIETIREQLRTVNLQ